MNLLQRITVASLATCFAMMLQFPIARQEPPIMFGLISGGVWLGVFSLLTAHFKQPSKPSPPEPK